MGRAEVAREPKPPRRFLQVEGEGESKPTPLEAEENHVDPFRLLVRQLPKRLDTHCLGRRK